MKTPSSVCTKKGEGTAMRRTLLAAVAIALSVSLPGAPSALAAGYTIDPSHTHVLFTVNHLGFSDMIGF
jgi:polyisoprenoid-binding protein YceI